MSMACNPASPTHQADARVGQALSMEQDSGGRLLRTQLHHAVRLHSQGSTAARGQVGAVEVEGEGVCVRQGGVVGQGGACTDDLLSEVSCENESHGQVGAVRSGG